MTPREPEEHTLDRFVILPEPAAPEDESTTSTTSSTVTPAAVSSIPSGLPSSAGFTLEGATVSAIQEGGTADKFAKYSFKKGDIILSISGERFETSRPIESYFKEGKRAYLVVVQRMVVPSRFPMSARLGAMALGVISNPGGGELPPIPTTEAAMEELVQDFTEYYRDMPMLAQAYASSAVAGMSVASMPAIAGYAKRYKSSQVAAPAAAAPTPPPPTPYEDPNAV